MAIRYHHSNIYAMYYCTFTCCDWIPLFQISNTYDNVYNWFKVLQEKYRGNVVAFVIMPNHLHVIIYFKEAGFDLNKIISNGKRFMAYEIIKRLEMNQATNLLNVLAKKLTAGEQKKGQLHKVFKASFDAKAIYSEKFLRQKLDYIHHNPVSGKWNLVNDFTQYEHSSASFYELSTAKHFTPLHYKDI
jgi:REP element-mobilizing transposase RayT